MDRRWRCTSCTLIAHTGVQIRLRTHRSTDPAAAAGAEGYDDRRIDFASFDAYKYSRKRSRPSPDQPGTSLHSCRHLSQPLLGPVNHDPRLLWVCSWGSPIFDLIHKITINLHGPQPEYKSLCTSQTAFSYILIVSSYRVSPLDISSLIAHQALTFGLDPPSI
jgi:hypothetical protein